ncbi:unnamed protein product [Ectocarpus sp. 13 AM-2016]
MVLTMEVVDLSSVAMSNATGPTHPPISSVFAYPLSAPSTKTCLLNGIYHLTINEQRWKDRYGNLRKTMLRFPRWYKCTQLQTVPCSGQVLQLNLDRFYQTTLAKLLITRT